MSHLSNPLASAKQLGSKEVNGLPIELQENIRFYTARLTQSAGLLLRLSQDVTAQAIIMLFRHWLSHDMMAYEFSVRYIQTIELENEANTNAQDTSAAAMYLTAKISASPRSLRSITNVYAYLTSDVSAMSPKYDPSKTDDEAYYLSESDYITFRNRILDIEGQILNAVGFNVHITLPYPLAITYLQALDLFSASSGISRRDATATAKRVVEYLNTALLSPQMLYLTHQPNSLAVAAIYLAARDIGVRLPESEWWEVFDCEREELGFLAVGMRSLEGWIDASKGEWKERGWIVRNDIPKQVGRSSNGKSVVEDEEDELMRMMDEKVS
jgi:hypothetical protein